MKCRLKDCRIYLRWMFAVSWFATLVFLWWLIIPATKSHREIVAFAFATYFACWSPFFLLSSRKRFHKVAAFICVTFCIVLVVALFEGLAALSLVDFRFVFSTNTNPWSSRRNRLDAELLHIHQPHDHLVAKIQGGELVRVGAKPTTFRKIEVRTDKFGFRNPRDYESADCVVLGDSFVEAWHVAESEMLTSRLEYFSNRTFANLGQTWYGPQQELAVLRRFGLKLRPKTCIWVFYEGNDLNDIWRYAQVSQDWDAMLRAESSFEARSFLPNALDCFIRIWHREERDFSGLFVPPNGDEIRMWFGVKGLEITAKDRQALEILRRVITDAHQLCVEHEIKLFFAFAPSKFRVYHSICKFEPGSEPASWTINPLPNLIKGLLDSVSTEIAFIDFTASFKRAANKGEVLYYPDDSHWSPKGHDIAAQTILESLRARGMTTPSRMRSLPPFSSERSK